jgi:hypothetical protein
VIVPSSRAFRPFRLALAAALAAAAGAGALLAHPQAAKAPAQNRFIGAAKCKNCHGSPKSGDPYSRWKEEKHSQAFARLASPEAKKLGQEKGVDDPQKSEQCVRCHVTAFKEPDERLLKGFDRHDGVQCESCHGPGEKHLKARMAAAAETGSEEGFGDEEPALQEIPKGEIVSRPSLSTCLECHNDQSPSFRPFCFKKRLADIAHFDPRKNRTQAELDAMKCGCGESCSCTQGECGEPGR